MTQNPCFHFTCLDRANQINKEGLKPKVGDNSKVVKDNVSKVSFSEGKYAAAALFAEFYKTYYDIKKGKRTAENSTTSKEMIDKVRNSNSFEEILGDGMYLVFDGTNIENTGGNNGHINPMDAGTKETIPPEMLKVCILKGTKTGETIYSKYDYALYMMCSLSKDDLFRLPDNRIKDIKFYKKNHKAQLKKLKKGDFIEEEITLDEFCKKYREEISEAEQKKATRNEYFKSKNVSFRETYIEKNNKENNEENPQEKNECYIRQKGER